MILNRRCSEKAGRCQTRRPANNALKAETTDESFEDLLLKYKQIQLELECIRKEERMALKDEDEPPGRCSPAADPVPPPEALEEPVSAVKEEKKVFQAFNIRPLRQKLLTPAERDALNSRTAQDVQRPDGDEGENDGNQDDGKRRSYASVVENDILSYKQFIERACLLRLSSSLRCEG